jgi:hypothetical protein
MVEMARNRVDWRLCIRNFLKSIDMNLKNKNKIKNTKIPRRVRIPNLERLIDDGGGQIFCHGGWGVAIIGPR